MHLACPNHISAKHWYALLTAQCRCCYQRMGRMRASQLLRWAYVVCTVPGRMPGLHACLMPPHSLFDSAIGPLEAPILAYGEDALLAVRHQLVEIGLAPAQRIQAQQHVIADVHIDCAQVE